MSGRVDRSALFAGQAFERRAQRLDVERCRRCQAVARVHLVRLQDCMAW